MCICVCAGWDCELDQALWTLPEKDSHMVPTQTAPGPAQQHQKVLWSLVSFTFSLFCVCVFLTSLTLENEIRYTCCLKCLNDSEYGSLESSSFKFKVTCVDFFLCSWRFFFYFATFTAGLGSLVKVSRRPLFHCPELKVDYWCTKGVTGKFGLRVDFVWIWGTLSNLPDSMVLGHQRVLGRISKAGEPEY